MTLPTSRVEELARLKGDYATIGPGGCTRDEVAAVAKELLERRRAASRGDLYRLIGQVVGVVIAVAIIAILNFCPRGAP